MIRYDTNLDFLGYYGQFLFQIYTQNLIKVDQFKFRQMLREQFIHQEVFTFSKHKKYVLTSIAITCMALIAIYNLSNHYQHHEPQLSTNNRTLTKYERNIKNKFYPCPKRHKVAYIWTFGEMPEIYKEFVERCKDNIIILNQTDYHKYMKMWSDMHPEHPIMNVQWAPFNTKNDYLKRLYLYFEGGVYADFDTEINQECWEDVYTEKIIFTNSWGAYGQFSVPQQNFIKVPRPFSPQLKQWMIEITYESRHMANRWDRCRREQCLILFCQNHNEDNSWVGVTKK